MFRKLETCVPYENIVFLDKVGFLVVLRPKRGRSLKGKLAYSFVSAARNRNISVLAFINKNRIIFQKIYNKTFSGEDFKLCLQKLYYNCQLKNIKHFVFVMDNAKIHHYKRLK